MTNFKINRKLKVAGICFSLLFGAFSAYSQEVEWMWSGGVTPTSAKVNARISNESGDVRLVVDTDNDLSDATLRSDPVSATGDLTSGNNRVAKLQIQNLQPNTQYHYALEVDGVLDSSKIGRFKTFPIGPSSFKFAFASCAQTGSESQVFTHIKNADPLFFMNTGDLHYNNIAKNDRSLFRSAYESVLASSTQSDLYQNIPFTYMWDDHDYGPNDGDRNAASKEASQLTYREYVPHYPLIEGDDGAAPVYQTFSVGRVFFILTDGRSEKSADNATVKTVMGEQQKSWFKNKLLEVNDEYPLIVWVQGIPWIGNEEAGTDRYFSYAEERKEFCNFIADNNIKQVVMLAGDAHMIAMDNGTNSDYSDSQNAQIPIFHASPLDRSNSEKGGPYSEGVSLKNNQYGVFEVQDNGGSSIKVNWTGKSNTETVMEYSFNVDAPSTVVNPAPTVEFGQPSTDFIELEEGSNLYILADAQDSDLVKVDLFMNGTKVRPEGRAPYEWGKNETKDPSLFNLAPGTYSFELVATDSEGSTDKATRTVVVVEKVVDTDGDGILDKDEANYGTNITLKDTDSDGIEDGDELAYWGTSWNVDSDNDGIINLLDSDSDNDGITDGEEVTAGTDPTVDEDANQPVETEIVMINAGGAEVGEFIADEKFNGGRTYTSRNTIDTTSVGDVDQSIYQTQRYGDFTYTQDDLEAGYTYTVKLHFAEVYQSAAGNRIFNVSANGAELLNSFDVFAEAGGKNIAITREFIVVADDQGVITLDFTSVVNNAKVNAIEILGTSLIDVTSIGELLRPAVMIQAGSIYTMAASGKDIWGTSDNFGFAQRELVGDGEIIVQVKSVDAIHKWTKAGVMIRESLDSDSANTSIVVVPGNGIFFQHRQTTGDRSYNRRLSGTKAPVWIKLNRTGDLFTASYSLDGSEWINTGEPVTIAMKESVFVGLCLTSHDVTKEAVAEFDNVEIISE